MIIKPLAQEVALTTTGPGSNIDLATVVRIVNNSATAGTITIQNAGVTVASMLIPGNQDVLVEKEPANTIFGTATTLRAVKVAFTN
jgi:hypothetical protein